MEQHKEAPRFRQGLIVALFCFLLAFFFYLMAVLEIRRTEKAILGIYKSNAIRILETLELISGSKARHFIEFLNKRPIDLKEIEAFEEVFNIQQQILVQMATRSMELTFNGVHDKKELIRLIDDLDVNSVILINKDGKVSVEGKHIPHPLQDLLREFERSNLGLWMYVWKDESSSEEYYLVAIRNEKICCTIGLVLTQPELEKWAFFSGVRETVLSDLLRGIDQLEVYDKKGRQVAKIGDLEFTEEYKDMELKGFIEGKPNGVRIIENQGGVFLDLIRPLYMGQRPMGIGRVLIDLQGMMGIKKRNQIQAYLFASIIILGAMIAIFAFYRLQKVFYERNQEMILKLARAERLSSLGKLAAGLAHEIKNPLNAISMAIQRIQREFRPERQTDGEEFATIIDTVRREIARLNKLIDEFLSPIRVYRSPMQPRSLTEVLQQVLEILGEEAKAKGLEMTLGVQGPDPMINMDQARLFQAFFNILKNAVDSMDVKGQIKVTIRPSGASHASVLIQDNGPGISEADLAKIFEFEYTTKEKGLGLGLPIALELIKAHGGDIKVQSEVGKGSLFEVILPVVKYKDPTIRGDEVE